jgi:hypothetical protein
MVKILTIALAFAALFVAEVKSQPRSSEAEVCNYNCLLGLQLASLDQTPTTNARLAPPDGTAYRRFKRSGLSGSAAHNLQQFSTVWH